MTTKEILASTLSCDTVRKAKLYYEMSGEKDVDMERAKNLLAEHFDTLLDARIGCSIGRGDITFEKKKEKILELLKAEPVDYEDLFSAIWDLYGDGLTFGYLAGLKDMESTLYFMSIMKN